MISRNYHALLPYAALLTLAPSGASAQTGQPAADASQAVSTDVESASGNEITVTARKRSESLLDVPASLSVFNTATLQNMQVSSVANLSHSVPSLFFQQRGDLSNAFTIRGVGGDPRNISLESGVSVVIDGAPLGRTNAFNTSLIDIAQIEVLRGPQGTLFGTNTIGGLINITTTKPDATTRVHLDAKYGNYSSAQTHGGISGALADDLFAGINFATWNGGNYIYNTTTKRHIQGHDMLGGRGTLRWQPSGDLTADLSIDYTRDDRNYILQQAIPRFIGFAAADPPPNRFTVDADQPTVSDLVTYGGNLNLNYNLGRLTATSITSLRRNRTLIYSDGESLAINSSASGPFTDVSHLITQELRLASNDLGPLKFTTGLFFSRQSAFADRSATIGGSAAAGYHTLAHIATNTYAILANADYNVTRKLVINGGIRYNIENKRGDYLQDEPLHPTLTYNFPDLHRSDKNVSWVASIRYKLTDLVSTYFTVSDGHKSGGFNVDIIGVAGATPARIAYRPETLTNYEVGLKGSAFDRMFTYAVSLFDVQYRDRQVSQYVSVGNALPYVVISNAGRSYTRGIEFEGTLNLPEQFTLRGSVSHLRARYTSFENATSAGASYTGHHTEFTPNWTGAISLDKRFSLSRGEFMVHGGAEYRGDTWLDASMNRQNFQSGYWLFDARVGYEFGPNSAPKRFGLYLFGRNLTNKDYLVFARQAATENQGLYAEPRMYGVELAIKY